MTRTMVFPFPEEVFSGVIGEAEEGVEVGAALLKNGVGVGSAMVGSGAEEDESMIKMSFGYKMLEIIIARRERAGQDLRDYAHFSMKKYLYDKIVATVVN